MTAWNDISQRHQRHIAPFTQSKQWAGGQDWATVESVLKWNLSHFQKLLSMEQENRNLFSSFWGNSTLQHFLSLQLSLSIPAFPGSGDPLRRISRAERLTKRPILIAQGLFPWIAETTDVAKYDLLHSTIKWHQRCQGDVYIGPFNVQSIPVTHGERPSFPW